MGHLMATTVKKFHFYVLSNGKKRLEQQRILRMEIKEHKLSDLDLEQCQNLCEEILKLLNGRKINVCSSVANTIFLMMYFEEMKDSSHWDNKESFLEYCSVLWNSTINQYLELYSENENQNIEKEIQP